MAAELKVVGLMNVQYAIKGDQLYVLEVNPRASRTIPFVSKATGVPLAKLATKVMLGKSLAERSPSFPRRRRALQAEAIAGYFIQRLVDRGGLRAGGLPSGLG